MSLYTASETNFYSSYLNQISMKKKKRFLKFFSNLQKITKSGSEVQDQTAQS